MPKLYLGAVRARNVIFVTNINWQGALMTMHAIGLTSLNNTAKDFRNDMSVGMFGATAARPTGGRSGVRYGTPTNTVSLSGFNGTIKPHSGFMDVQTSATAGPYWYSCTANETFTVSAAHATLPRVDIVTIRINDTVEDASGLETCTTHYKAGTAAASPVAPTPDTTRELIIATVAVPASGGGNPAVSWVAPYAVAAGGIIPVRNVTERAALYTAYPATADCPVIVWQGDIKLVLTTTDGVNWKDGSGRFIWADATARGAATGAVSGDKGLQLDTKVEYTHDGSGWKQGVKVSMQLDTTNSTPIVVTQYGIGKIQGNGTGVLTETVTFPVAFAAGVTPVINTTNAGVRATGAFNPAGLNPGGYIPTGTYAVSNTGFTVRFDSGVATMGNTNDFYYTWSATGALA